MDAGLDAGLCHTVVGGLKWSDGVDDDIRPSRRQCGEVGGLCDVEGRVLGLQIARQCFRLPGIAPDDQDRNILHPC